MEGFLKLSTQVTKTITAIDSVAHIVGKTGLSAGLTIYLTKAGATPASIAPTVAELDSTNMPGTYSLVFTTTHTNTLGEFHILVTGSGMDPLDLKWEVTTYLPGEAVTLQSAQKVDVDTIKTNPVVNAGTITFPTTATLASTTNITAATGIDLTKVNGHVVTDTASGVLDVNAKNINNVAATSVTTINANLGQTQPVNFTGTAGSALVKTDMIDIASAAVSASTAQLGVNVVNWRGGAVPVVANTGVPVVDVNFWNGSSVNSLAAGRVDVSVGAMVSGTITDAAFAAGTGKKVIRANTAAAGAGSTITLDASASAVDNFYADVFVYLTGGTGIGQVRTIISYVGATQVATVDRAWATNPDNTSTFALLPMDQVVVVTNNDKTGYAIGAGGIANAAFAADAITAAKVASDVTDEIWALACVEPTAAVAATPSMKAAISWLLTYSRNLLLQTSSVQTLKADDNATTIATANVSDDGTTFTRSKVV